MSAIRYHGVWLATAIVLLFAIGVVHSNSPLALLGAVGLLGAAAVATFVENKLFIRNYRRRSTMRERLKFSLWCGGLAFPMFFLTSLTLLWVYALLLEPAPALSVPIHNFWVFMTFFPQITHYLSIPVVFGLTLLLSTGWAQILKVPAAANNAAPSSNAAV